MIVDLDPQGNASTGLGIDRKSRTVSTYDMLLGEATVVETAIATSVPRVSVAPSTLDLLGVELEIADRQDRAFRLRTSLFGEGEDDPSRPRNYSYILIDCPPSLNLLTINALAAAHSILVPLQCEFFALEGLSQLLSTVEQVKAALNPELSIHGIVLTMYDARNNLSGTGRGRCAGAHGRRGLRDHYSAERARVGGAVVRQAGCCFTISIQAAARPT